MNTATKHPDIAMEEVDSSQIHSRGHHPETNTLAIRFKDKDGKPAGLYHYANFTAEHYAEYKKAESVGSYFYKNIKPHTDKHPYVKVS